MLPIVESQNSACGIVTHRRDITLICFFLREVWGECGEAVKGKVTYRRYAPVLNLIRLSVQYDFVLCTLRFSPDIKSRFCPFYILVWYLLWSDLNSSNAIFEKHVSFDKR